jgi:hypothetical protein
VRDKAETPLAESASSGEVVLLPDDPAEEDAFAAKAHERVARAIADLVCREPGGKVLGLEGSWGSGKSTVVRLLSKQVAERTSPPAAQVVVFDAWAHEGDPLRRSFLETLIEALEAASWLDGELAGGIRARLTGKASETTTRSTERLSTEGRWAAASAIFVPLGAVLAANRFHTLHRFGIGLGILLMLAPLIVVLGFWAAHRIALRLRGGEKPEGTWLRRLADMQPFSFFAKEQKIDTFTEGVERGDPTSVEFESLFSQTLDAALTDERRLVLVLDNIDRVDEKDARTVLATMQTFTGGAKKTGSLSKSNVWTLIPYDPNGLDRLWKPPPGDDEVSGGDVQDAAPTSVAFADKVFQARFQAPPLALSDWRSYLQKLAEQALPRENSDSVRRVVRLRSLYPGSEPDKVVAGESPTPRQLKQFVNQIGAIWRQRRDIALQTVAYYVLLKRDRFAVAEALLSGTIPHEKLAYLFRPEVAEELAALHFGASPELAQQLLLRPALDRALRAGDSKAVEDLKGKTGFTDALDGLDVQGYATDGGIELARMVALLGDLDGEPVRAWSHEVLEPLTTITSSWRLDGAESGVGLARLFQRSAADAAGLAELLSRIAPTALDGDEDGHRQLDGLAAFTDELTTLPRGDGELRIRIDIPPERLVDSLAYYRDRTQGSRAAYVLEPTTTPVEVADALVEAAKARNENAGTALDLLLARSNQIDFEELAEKSMESLRGRALSSPEQLSMHFRYLDEARNCLRKSDEGLTRLEAILGSAADDGTLLHYVALAQGAGWHEPAAVAGMLHLGLRPDLPEPAHTGESPTGIQLLRSALADPSSYPDLVGAQTNWLTSHNRQAFDFVANVAVRNPASRPWVLYQLKALFDADALPISTSQYLENGPLLQEALGEDGFEKETRVLLDRAASRRKILQSTDQSLALASLKASQADPAPSYATEVVAWAGRLLESVGPDGWTAALDAGQTSPTIELALRVSGLKPAPTDPPGLEEGLRAHCERLIAGESAWLPDGSTFRALTKLLSPRTRRALASTICARLEGLGGSIPASLFTTYGEFLGGEAGFRTHEKLPNVIDRLVANDDWTAVEWFVGVARKHPDAVKRDGREDYLDHLRASVSARLDNGQDQPDILHELSQLLGNEPRREPAGSDSGSS